MDPLLFEPFYFSLSNQYKKSDMNSIVSSKSVQKKTFSKKNTGSYHFFSRLKNEKEPLKKQGSSQKSQTVRRPYQRVRVPQKAMSPLKK